MNRSLLPLLFASTLMASEAFSPSTGYINHAGIVVSATHLAGFATSPAIGAISFGNHIDTAAFSYANTAPDNYGVNNDGRGNLSGYAYSSTVGWITFNPSNSGVVIDPKTGLFTGFAYNENIGWIAFSGTAQDGSTYAVTTDWRADDVTDIVDVGPVVSAKISTGIGIGPNPVDLSRGSVEIVVTTNATATIKMTIINPLGKIIDVQKGETVSNGAPYRFNWNLKDRTGAAVSSGGYLAVAQVKLADGSAKVYKTMIGIRE